MLSSDSEYLKNILSSLLGIQPDMIIVKDVFSSTSTTVKKYRDKVYCYQVCTLWLRLPLELAKRKLRVIILPLE